MLKMLFVGDSSTGLEIEIKGSDAEFFVRPHRLQTWLVEAISAQQISVVHMTTEQASSKFPFSLDELKQYQVIMFSDVDSDSFQLYPNFMGASGRVPLGPNRLKLVEQYVRDGGAFIMGGGYASFSGRRGIGNYRRTPIEKILPVNIIVGDDREEWPEGFHGDVRQGTHPILKGLNWEKESFVFLGYNATTLKPEADVLVEHEGNPIVAAWQYGKGRTMAFTPDPQPHWSGNFHLWSGYGKFWQQSIAWLTKQGD